MIQQSGIHTFSWVGHASSSHLSNKKTSTQHTKFAEIVVDQAQSVLIRNKMLICCSLQVKRLWNQIDLLILKSSLGRYMVCHSGNSEANLLDQQQSCLETHVCKMTIIKPTTRTTNTKTKQRAQHPGIRLSLCSRRTLAPPLQAGKAE